MLSLTLSFNSGRCRYRYRCLNENENKKNWRPKKKFFVCLFFSNDNLWDWTKLDLVSLALSFFSFYFFLAPIHFINQNRCQKLSNQLIDQHVIFRYKKMWFKTKKKNTNRYQLIKYFLLSLSPIIHSKIERRKRLRRKICG